MQPPDHLDTDGYLQASACNDRRAHCHTVLDDPYDEEVAADPEGFTVRLALAGTAAPPWTT